MQALTRRRAMGRLGLLAGSAAAAPLLVGAATGSTASTAPFGTTRFDITVEGLRSLGAREGAGTQHVLAGAVASVEGTAAGWFHAVATVVGEGSRFAEGPAPLHLEHHTFQLPKGTIIGQGSTSHDGTGSFAVVGGTGAYHGATGSYHGTRTVGGFGGDTASYSFTLHTPEVAPDGR